MGIPPSLGLFLSEEGQVNTPSLCIGSVFHPSSQGGLCLLSGTTQGPMEPLKVATRFGMGEKAPTTEKHFVVILGSATQFHLGDKPTSALELPSLQSGTYLRMRVFFQCLHHHLQSVFKQIDGTPFLGTLEPQWTKIGSGVDTFNESMGMKGARFIQEMVELGFHLVQSCTSHSPTSVAVSE